MRCPLKAVHRQRLSVRLLLPFMHAWIAWGLLPATLKHACSHMRSEGDVRVLQDAMHFLLFHLMCVADVRADWHMPTLQAAS